MTHGQLLKITGIMVVASVAVLASAQTQSPYNFYRLGPSPANSDKANLLGRNFGARLVQAQFTGGVFQMGDGSVRGAFVQGAAGFMFFQPDLSKGSTSLLPPVQETRNIGLNFANKFGLFMRDATSPHMGEMGVITNEPSTAPPTGGPPVDGKPTDQMRFLRFTRSADGLDVMGPSSIFTVDVNGDGVVGFTHTLRPVNVDPNAMPVVPKTADQVNNEFYLRLHQATPNGATPKLLSRKLIYYEQGLNFVQPAYWFDVQFTDPKGNVSTNQILIGLALNSPESVGDHCVDGLDPTFPAQPATRTSVPGTESLSTEGLWASTAASPALQANPVQVGEYIVREDHHCWLDDANTFWGNLAFWAPLTGHAVNRRDYWWDVPWVWEAYAPYGDNSPYYVGQDHFALIEGHGAPWVITCFKDYGEVIHLNQIAGYGVYQNSQEKTAYIEWQSCDVIPEPGHPFEADYTSGSAFGVWWNIFKGMRANFGYRTVMRICNGVSGGFAFRLAIGCPNTSSWLDATNAGVFGHSNGLDYGNTVLVSGHENDTFYNNAQLPTPSSLTMWWCHA